MENLVPDDPIRNIEDEKSQHDMGVMAARVLAGAIEESEDFIHAYFACCALFRGMFGGPFPPDDKDEENK